MPLRLSMQRSQGESLQLSRTLRSGYVKWTTQRSPSPVMRRVTATSADGEVMGVRHRQWPVEGVQFHPEAILTEHGHALLRNFLAGVH